MQSTITESHNQEPLASAELSLKGAGGQDVCDPENKPWLISARSKGRESRASSMGEEGAGSREGGIYKGQASLTVRGGPDPNS